MTTSIVNGGAVIDGAGGGGASLPATPAEALLDAGNPLKLVYLDAGGAGAAIPFEDATDTGMSEIMSALAGGNAAEGNFLVADGAGGLQLASTDAAAVRTVIGASGANVLYASDGVAEAGSESASISGTGASSTVTLTASTTTRTFGTAGRTAAGWRLNLPSGVQRVSVEIQLTAASGLTSGGWRYLGLALSNQSDVTTTLCGFGLGDNGNSWSGNMLGGANSGVGPTTTSPTVTAADRWLRAVFELDAGPRIRFATGTGTAGARPGVWSPPATAIPAPGSGATGTVVDSNNARLWFYLQSFGSGGATSLTARITVRPQ